MSEGRTRVRERTVGAFVRARRAGWERLDALAARAGGERLALAEVEELDRLYRRATADLARARTAFPGSDAEGYLAQVLARAHGALYRPPRRGLAAALRRQAGALPRAFRAHRGAFAAALALLAAGVGGGALAVALDPAAAALLVPAGIRSTIAARRMWTESLLSAAPGVTGSAIAHNNLSVAALAFALGLTGGAGTALLLVANGLVLGAVLAAAWQGGMGGPFLGFVAAHGPAELLALLLAAQGGFILADGLVRPGEWPRTLAVQAAGREGARLVAAAIPVLGFVALLESAVSPRPDLPAWAKAALGLGLAAAIGLWLSRAGRRGSEVSGPGASGPA